jgi:hypothetical protein
MKIINWFKNLGVAPQYIIGIALWTILCLWIGSFLGNIDFCPESKYSWDCSLGWVDTALILTVLIVWAGSILAVMSGDDRIK